MYGSGILKGLGVTFRHFVTTFVDDIKWLGRKRDLEVFQQKQSLANKGLVTVEYPDEKLAVPERFRFIPFLLTYNQDDPEYPGKDWCTSCGICAKVCPPQCIWIVRGADPKTGRPKPEPENFFIDIDICMNCGYCAEYCPFDAIKMDHDYEMASYDRTSAHIHDKARLSKEIRYWEQIAPTTAAEEEKARGGYDHTDVQKARKKAGLPASRPGPISEKAPAPVAAVAAPAAAPAEAAAPTAGGEGKPAVVRRRGDARGAAAAQPTATPAAESAPAEATPAPAAEAAPAAATPTPAPTGDSDLPPGFVRRGKRIINLNEQPTSVVKRKTEGPKE